MGEFVTIVGLVLLTGVIFVLWLAITIGKLIVSAIFGLAGGKPATTVHDPKTQTVCRHAGCGAINPTYARFCKRCGRSTGAAAHVPMRYVA